MGNHGPAPWKWWNLFLKNHHEQSLSNFRFRFSLLVLAHHAIALPLPDHTIHHSPQAIHWAKASSQVNGLFGRVEVVVSLMLMLAMEWQTPRARMLLHLHMGPWLINSQHFGVYCIARALRDPNCHEVSIAGRYSNFS